MKKTWTVLAAALLLVWTLSACGGSGVQNDVESRDGILGGAQNDGMDDTNGNSDVSGSRANDGSGLHENGSLTGNSAADGLRSGGPGASYDQMLRNARVHDGDGDLTDWENSVTPGATTLF